MDKLDLEIDNYSLEDLLRLFKLNIDFNKNDLKRAKSIVLNTHPDKSRLPNEYFFFFSKAYKIIYNIYMFKNTSNNSKPLEYENLLLQILQQLLDFSIITLFVAFICFFVLQCLLKSFFNKDL